MNRLTFTVAVSMACANAIEASYEETINGTATVDGITGIFSRKTNFEGINNATEYMAKSTDAVEASIIFDTAPTDKEIADVYTLWSCSYIENLDEPQWIVCDFIEWYRDLRQVVYRSDPIYYEPNSGN